MTASIATCHVENCEFNQNMDCLAPGGITVNMHQDHADCETFEEKE
jgi:hypothetical protein